MSSAPSLTVTAPGGLKPIPINKGASSTPSAWVSADQKLVDVGTIVGTDGKAVDRYLCGPATNLEAPSSTLPAGSLNGAIALVSRGYCTFASKALPREGRRSDRDRLRGQPPRARRTASRSTSASPPA